MTTCGGEGRGGEGRGREGPGREGRGGVERGGEEKDIRVGLHVTPMCVSGCRGGVPSLDYC